MFHRKKILNLFTIWCTTQTLTKWFLGLLSVLKPYHPCQILKRTEHHRHRHHHYYYYHYINTAIFVTITIIRKYFQQPSFKIQFQMDLKSNPTSSHHFIPSTCLLWPSCLQYSYTNSIFSAKESNKYYFHLRNVCIESLKKPSMHALISSLWIISSQRIPILLLMLNSVVLKLGSAVP